jgi:tetratricopeptide (TPR) repeat protein
MKSNLLFILFLFVSCDFTSNLHKEILSAQEYFEKGQYHRSVYIYESLIQRNIKQSIRTKILFQLGNIYLIFLKNPDKSSRFFKEIVETEKRPLWQVKALEKYAEINFEYLNNYKASYLAYKKLYDFRPKLAKSDKYKYLMANSLIKFGNYKDAINILNSIKSQNSNQYYAQSFFMLGQVNFFLKDWSNAIKHFETYLTLETDRIQFVRTKFLIANSYEMLEELGKAYKIYTSIQDHYPNYQVIKNRINSLYERRVSRKR